MANILAIGNAVLDIVNLVECYPHEDQEVRAKNQWFSRGGNASNTLTVLAQLGHQCDWAGCLATDANSHWLEQDFERSNISTRYSHRAEGVTPTSYISLSESTGSRTIVHFRDLPEYSQINASKIHFNLFHWIHIEGRNISEVEKMLRQFNQRIPSITLSLEVEKKRSDIERLIPLADIIFFSKHYANEIGFNSKQLFIAHLQKHYVGKKIAGTWGAEGAFAIDNNGKRYIVDAVPVQVVDTTGAGDTFIAGFVHRMLERGSMEEALDYANTLAGKKCGQKGLKNLI